MGQKQKTYDELEKQVAALVEEQQRLKGIIEGARLGTWEWNVQTGECNFNEMWAEFLGYTLEELAPLSIKTWEKLAHPDDLRESGRRLEEHFTGQIPWYSCECRMRHKDGHWIWVHDHGKVITRTSEGKPLMMFGTHTNISARKQTETALEDRNRFIESLVDMTVYVLYIYDIVEKKNVYSNNGIENLLGYSAAEIQEMGNQLIPLLMHPDDLAGYTNNVLPRYAQARDGEHIAHEYRMKHKSGEWRWLHSNETIYRRQPDGAPKQIFGVIHDISERKNFEQALLESKTETERYLNVAAEIIISLDSEGTITLLNDNGHAMLGYDKGELIGKNWFDTCLQASDINEVKGVFKKLMEGEIENVINYENPVRTKDGETKTVFWHNTLLRDNEDNIIGLLSSGEDMTEWHRARAATEEEKERLATTLRSIGDGVITTDTTGAVAAMNTVAEQLTGWTQEEAMGKPIESVFKIIQEFTRKPCENPVPKVLREGRIIELANHAILVSRDGHERIVADSGAPIKDANERTIGVVLVFRDETEKRKMADAIQKTTRLESLGVLAGGIAHDFNNLLGGIFGYLDLALEETRDGQTRDYLVKGLKTLDRARDLTQQLLTFAKGGAPVKEASNLNAFVRETVAFALSGSAVSPQFDIEKTLWLCEFDKNQISQVIDNIVINSQQAMPKGGAIFVSAENVVISDQKPCAGLPPGKYVRVAIRDEGVGIPPEILPRIFDPFFTTKPKGHGLGLATCFSIIKKHNGRLDVDSHPGKGTTFSILLPAGAQSTPGSAAASENTHNGDGLFVIMDDEEFMRDILSAMLESFGYTVVCHSDGQAAVDFVTESAGTSRQIVGMIFDLTVPGGMGGKEAICSVRQIAKDIPVFVASGYAEDPVMSRPADFGFTASISKPFVRATLAKLLNSYMSSD